MEELITLVRYIINDPDSASYTDARLQKAIVVAAQYVNTDLFSNKYTITITGSGTITPDYSSDNSFKNLTALKTACMIGLGEAKLAGGQGISIKDGTSSLDLRGVSQAKYQISQDFCKMYEQARMNFLTNGDFIIGRPGEAIIGPTTYWANYGRYQ